MASHVASDCCIVLAAVANAKKKIDAMIANVSSSFAQTDVAQAEGERVVVKIRGSLVDALIKID